jgi:WD40 repeat protein
MTWTGDAYIRGTHSLDDLKFFRNSKDPIAQITYSPTMDLFGLITVDGYAYICTRLLPNNSDRVKWNGTCIYDPNEGIPAATTLEFNPRFNYAAVGNVQGVVRLYEISAELDVKISHDVAITKPGDKANPIKLSAVTCISWSSDGYAIAFSWIFGGFSVWSLFGCLLTSTISEDTFVHSSDGIVTDTEELFFTGVQDLFWAPGDHYLYLLPSSASSDEIFDIYALEFGKSSILQSLSDVFFLLM